MKKLLFLVLLLSNFFGFAQYTLIPDVNFEKVLIRDGFDNGIIDGKVLTASISGIINLNVSNYQIQDLKGLQDFVSLEILDCSWNGLTSIDVSKNTSLKEFNCNNNNLSILDVSKNSILVKLQCYQNKLINLDISNNLFLTYLMCSLNKITNLDVTKNVFLNRLECGQNQLANLNLSNNINLTQLICYENNLTNLDLSQNILLTDLWCLTNKLNSLDLSKNNKLKNIWCENNQLTSLNISNSNDLQLLHCFNNKLTNLDISHINSLSVLLCNNNQLTSLNLKNGNNTNLIAIDLTRNPYLICIQVDNINNANTRWPFSKDATASYSENCSRTTATIAPPVITAIGNQIYCAGTSLNIVETISIAFDPAEPTTDAVTIQISSGYTTGDLLTLSNPSLHPTISIGLGFNSNTGMLKLSSLTGNKIPYAEFEAAIKDVKFSSSSIAPSGVRTFSINLGTGQLSYLPRNKHFYEYVPAPGITWTDAKAAAALKNYYGLQGYLATLTAADEAQLAGAQAPGAGWIGGSDAETEGTWKWVTGPETGTIMAYTKWNNGEPNNSNGNTNGIGEDYAHITAPGVGLPGSWNDLTNTGETNGNYQPKGYIVEYGGMVAGDVDNIQISASTTITIPAIASTTPSQRCGSGSLTLKAIATNGTVNWFDAATGGNPIATGNSYSTPNLTTPTTYYVDAGTNCSNPRTPITAIINNPPVITSTNTPASRCGAGAVTLQASSDSGIINWYSEATGGNILGTGTSFTTSSISQNATYYAEAQNNGCFSSGRTPVEIKIYSSPIVTDEELTICKSSSLTLDAQIPNMTYSWSTGESTQTITIESAGNYYVDITSPTPENCTSRKKITVIQHSTPEINYIDVNETTITIYLKNEEAYFEYSIDGINYQSSNVFFNSPSGLQTAYVREVNFCSYDTKPFIVLITPKFFTPNNDTYNDAWEVKGLVNYPEAEVSIFDRYGKLITVLNARNLFWDGTSNNSLLPATDYWYVLKIDKSKPEVRGHFSLKR